MLMKLFQEKHLVKLNLSNVVGHLLVLSRFFVCIRNIFFKTLIFHQIHHNSTAHLYSFTAAARMRWTNAGEEAMLSYLGDHFVSWQERMKGGKKNRPGRRAQEVICLKEVTCYLCYQDISVTKCL